MPRYALPVSVLKGARLNPERAANPRRDSGRTPSPRLVVSRPSDAVEGEADHTAARALHARATSAKRARERAGPRRLTAPPLAPHAVPTRADVVRARDEVGASAPLPATVRSDMEARTGH